MLAYLDTLIGFAVVMLGMSLLITVLTEIISAALSLRGLNLRWGIRTLLAQIDPRRLPHLVEQADELAQAILTHPLISDSFLSGWADRFPGAKRFLLATAIRPGELASILQWIGSSKEYRGSPVEAEIAWLLGEPNPVASRQLNLLNEASAILQQSGVGTAALVGGAIGSVREPAGNLEAWFHCVMDRVSQRFAMHVRIATILCSVILAFATGLDSIALMNDLYRRGDFRERLVAQAPAMLGAAGKVLPPGAKTPDEAATQAMAGIYTDALKKGLADANAPVTAPVTLAREDEGRRWIDIHVPAEKRASTAEAFGSRISEATKSFIEQRAKDGAEITAILNNAGFPVAQLYWPSSRAEFIGRLPGILATAALLSLGAPFWFNLLKQVANLRPILASRVKADEN